MSEANVLYPTDQPIVIPPISIDDLLNSVEVLKKKEEDDKVALESIGNLSPDTLKQKLVNWAIAGFPNCYEIYRISVSAPNTCSDGVSRNLADYIVYCSGKTIHEHVQVLATKVSGINVLFSDMGTYISIVVIKA